MTIFLKECTIKDTSPFLENQNISLIPKFHAGNRNSPRADFGMPTEEVRAMFTRISRRAQENKLCSRRGQQTKGYCIKRSEQR